MSCPDSSNSKCTSLYTQGMYGAGSIEQQAKLVNPIIHSFILDRSDIKEYMEKASLYRKANRFDELVMKVWFSI